MDLQSMCKHKPDEMGDITEGFFFIPSFIWFNFFEKLAHTTNMKIWAHDAIEKGF